MEDDDEVEIPEDVISDVSRELIPEESKTIIKASGELKQTYRYLFARHLSSQGLPDDYSHLRQIIVAFFGDERFYTILVKELEKLEELQKQVWGAEYEQKAKTGEIYTKQMVLDSIHFFKKEYYKCDFINAKIHDLAQKYEGRNQDKAEQPKPESHSDNIRNELKHILKEVNLNLPVINDCLLIAFTILVKNSDLIHELAPKEEIISPLKYKYDDKIKRRGEPDAPRWLRE